MHGFIRLVLVESAVTKEEVDVVFEFVCSANDLPNTRAREAVLGVVNELSVEGVSTVLDVLKTLPGCVPSVLSMLGSGEEGIRMAALQLLGCLLHNNAKMRAAFGKMNGFAFVQAMLASYQASSVSCTRLLQFGLGLSLSTPSSLLQCWSTPSALQVGTLLDEPYDVVVMLTLLGCCTVVAATAT